MPDTYDHITLMSRLKAAQRRNKELESGERYIQLEELHQKEYNVYEHKIEKLKKELADAHKETIRVRNYWLQVLEDMLREFEKAQKRSAQELRKMEIRALNAEKQRDDALDKAAVFRHQFYEAASRLEEEQGKNLKLRAQINRDYENSSIPSSKAVRRKKITNNRKKTVRKPGGQPGHKGHCRKRQEPTQPVILLPPPEEVLEDCAFKKTARTIVKQMVSIRMVLNVTEYHADVYYNSHTGERAHAAFPDGVIDDVNYDGSIRAFLSDLTGGKLNISKGMISRLNREFALKTEPERWSAYADMLLSPVMHTDCTNARENGKSYQVYVCATPDGKALYFARENMHNHLLFLHDIRVPVTNNEAERLLRNYKRKQAQAVTFRSFESIDYLCQCMSMLVLMRLEDPANIYDRVSRIFG